MKIIKELIPYAVIVIVVVIIRSFLVTPVIVDGLSMYPTLDDKQLLILGKYDKSIERNDIVVLNYKNEKLIKRIIGLPNEVIEYKNNKLYVNKKEVNDKFATITEDFKSTSLSLGTIPKDYYLVLGDNRNDSIDSRVIGFINKDEIDGVIKFSLWPLSKFGKIE